MHWHLFAIGKPKLGFARDGVEEYAKRLRPLAAVSIEYIKPARGDGHHTDRVAHKPKFKVAAKIQGELGPAKGKKKSKKRTARKRA